MPNFLDRYSTLFFSHFTSYLRYSWWLLCLMTAFRVVLYFTFVQFQVEATWAELLLAYFTGFRFDLCVLGFIALVPLLLSFFAAVSVSWFVATQKLLKAYYLLMSLALSLFFIFDYSVLVERGERLRLADFSHLGSKQIDIVFAMLVVFGFVAFLRALVRLPLRTPKVERQTKALATIKVLAPCFIVALAARGHLGQHHIRYEDAQISQHSLLNEMALTPGWTFNK